MSADGRLMTVTEFARWAHRCRRGIYETYVTGSITEAYRSSSLREVTEDQYRHHIIREQMRAKGYITKL